MSAKITHMVLKSHAWFENHTRACGIAASQNPIQIFCWSYVKFIWFVRKSHASCWNSSRACVNHTRTCRYYTLNCHNHTRESHNYTHLCRNHTLRVEITLVRVEITVVSVVFTFVRAKITLRVEITLCVLCVYKSHSACWNHSRECRNYICACKNLTMRAEIAICVYKSHSYVLKLHSCVLKSHSCVLKSHFAFRNFTRTCDHHNIHVNIFFQLFWRRGNYTLATTLLPPPPHGSVPGVL
jgi:hypothetical protein